VIFLIIKYVNKNYYNQNNEKFNNIQQKTSMNNDKNDYDTDDTDDTLENNEHNKDNENKNKYYKKKIKR